MKKHKKPLTATEIASMRDEDINFSDIPELDESFWRNAELVEPCINEEKDQSIGIPTVK